MRDGNDTYRLFVEQKHLEVNEAWPGKHVKVCFVEICKSAQQLPTSHWQHPRAKRPLSDSALKLLLMLRVRDVQSELAVRPVVAHPKGPWDLWMEG